MGSRRGLSTYLVLVFGAIVTMGLFAGLQLQLDQQTARTAMLKEAAAAAFLARLGLDDAARRLAATGGLPATWKEPRHGGELEVRVEGPRPAGSRKYIVFSRGRHLRGSVTTVADLKFSTPVATVANEEIIYQDVDVTSAQVRSSVIARRATERRELVQLLQGFRAEGSGLSSRVDRFLTAAAAGSIPAADRARVVSVLPATLTTALP